MHERLALSTVEIACDLSDGVPAVVRRIARTASEAAPHGPIMVCTFGADAFPDPESSCFEKADDNYVRVFTAGSLAMPRALRRELLALPPTVMEPGTAQVERFPAHLRAAVQTTTPLSVLATTGDGGGLCIAFSDPGVWQWKASQFRYLDAMAKHLAAVWRLRAGLTAGKLTAGISAELRLDGTPINLVSDASTPVAREALRAAVLRRERSRTAKRSAEGERLWPALVLGRWSLLDAFTAAGARYVVAYENPPAAAWLRALPARERIVLEHALSGRSGKWIALELELSEPTVTRALRAALRRLGVGNIAAAAGVRAALFEPLHRVGFETSLAVASLTRLAALARLSPAEREVMSGIARGSRIADIASDRGSSPRTVGHQLASIYKKLGVGSRRELLALLD